MSDEPARITRRRWLAMSMSGPFVAAASMAAGDAGGAAQGAPSWIGVQLYTVRADIARDAKATLEAIARIGYKDIELLQPTLATVVPLARQLGLNPVSVHLDGPTAAGEGLAAFIGQARDAGLRYLVMPWIAPADRPVDTAGFESLGGRLNRMGEQIARAGLQLCYHNHAFEFGTSAAGARWLDVLMKATDPALVKLELDVFWVSITGANPLDLIRQYSGRIALMHLKDKARGAGPTLREDQVPRDAFVEVGTGALDFPAILSAARAAGVAHYFVEQDQTAGSPIDSLRESYRYLSSLR